LPLRALILTIVAGFTIGCGPVPGGSLAGEPAQVPAAWSDAINGEKTLCEIESRPANPHSIQLECFEHEGRLHVQSHRWAFAPWWPTESWAAIWLEDPDVTVRIDGALFELSAVHVADPAQRKSILVARGYDPVPDGIAVFRFDPRF